MLTRISILKLVIFGIGIIQLLYFVASKGFLLKYLTHVDNGVDFKDKMEKIDEAVEMDYDGNRTFKDIEILVNLDLMPFLFN